jgi:hypothetical protein
MPLIASHMTPVRTVSQSSSRVAGEMENRLRHELNRCTCNLSLTTPFLQHQSGRNHRHATQHMLLS